MPGHRKWILESPVTEILTRVLVINPALEVDALFGVMLVADHFRMDTRQIEVGRWVFAATSDDHFGFGGFAHQGLHDGFDR